MSAYGFESKELVLEQAPRRLHADAPNARLLRRSLCAILAIVFAMGMMMPIIPQSYSLPQACADEGAGDTAPGDTGGDTGGGDTGGDTGGGDTGGGTGGGDTGGGDTGGGDTGGDTGGGDTGGDTGGGDTGGDTGGGDTGGDTGGGSEDPQVADGIFDIAIYYKDTVTCVGETSHPNRRESTISERAGSLEFYTVATWDDWSTTIDDYHVQWETSDPSVFRVYGGTVEAVGDGTAELIAYVTADDNPNRTRVEARATITVTGQNNAFYVVSIRIADANGNAIPAGEPFIITGDLATEMYQFTAIVDIHDTTTGTTRTYKTVDGPLSAQVEGMSDIQWYVGDPAMSTVDNDIMAGMWRPVVYGISSLHAYSNAGEGNARVSASVTIAMRDPDGGIQDDEFHPQSSLTVLAYYEMYPPESLRNKEDKRFVINKTFSLDELAAMGTVTATYTAFGKGSYFTMTGTGVPLATVIQEAGVNLEGAKTVAFGTADNIDRPVSWSYIFDTNRYYFPNIDMMNFSEAQQVYPILAFESNLSKNAGTDPDYNMTEATRFRLLFGSTTDGGTSQYQIKWIHTLYITLAGGPAVNDGDGEGGGGGDGGAGAGTGGDTGAGTGSGENGMDAGGGTTGEADSNATENGTDAASSAKEGLAHNAAATAPDPQTDKAQSVAEEGAAGGTDGTNRGTANDTGMVREIDSKPEFSIYQVMNAVDSDTDTTLDSENPLKPVAAAGGGLALLLGALESAIWFRRQTRVVAVMTSVAASAA